MVQQPPTKSHWLYRLVRWGAPLQIMLIGAALLLIDAEEAYLARQSPAWPVVQGTIQTSVVQHTPLNYKGSKYHASVVYAYVVDGQPHHNHMLHFRGMTSNAGPEADRLLAQATVNRYPVGKPVSVYCRPGHPDTCVLEPGLRDRSWYGMGLTILVGGLLLLVLFPWLLMKTARSSRRA